jgi:hypothetical protein
MALGLVAACSDDDPVVLLTSDAGIEQVEDAGTGAGGSGWPVPPVLRNQVALPDFELAREALTLMGSADVDSSGSCRSCHSLGRPTLSNWSQLTRSFVDACLEDPALEGSAELDEMLDCFQSHADKPSLEAHSFGIYSAAAHLPWFSFLFERSASSAQIGAAEHERFVQRVGMPRSGQRWSQAQFDLVAEWFARGLPGLFELVPADMGEACTPRLDARLTAHVDALSLTGWRARNAEVPLLMFGCESDQSSTQCLGDFPLARDASYSSDWEVPGTRIRILHDNSRTPSTYWSRSSADGRYIGSGLLEPEDPDFAGQILDLARDEQIAANFSYDATFFPDNSGFLLQQGGGFSSSGTDDGPTDGSADVGDAALICNISLLSEAPEQITGDEDQCVVLESQIGLYQQLAKSIDGEDYWVIYGSYDSDDGGFQPVYQNPSAAFEADSTATLVPMINQGDGFEAAAPTRIPMPRQGDPILSPSGRLLVTRVKGQEVTSENDGVDVVQAEQSGYALYTVSMSQEDGDWSASIEDVGRICLTGGKAVVSYDERWMVLHHYVTPEDGAELGFTDADAAGFEDYAAFGASNLYLVDLRTGNSQRISNMQPGQYALFPHFRSDGWIYFVVRTIDGDEYFAASDAALIAEGAPGALLE